MQTIKIPESDLACLVGLQHDTHMFFNKVKSAYQQYVNKLNQTDNKQSDNNPSENTQSDSYQFDSSQMNNLFEHINVHIYPNMDTGAVQVDYSPKQDTHTVLVSCTGHTVGYYSEFHDTTEYQIDGPVVSCDNQVDYVWVWHDSAFWKSLVDWQSYNTDLKQELETLSDSAPSVEHLFDHDLESSDPMLPTIIPAVINYTTDWKYLLHHPIKTTTEGEKIRITYIMIMCKPEQVNIY